MIATHELPIAAYGPAMSKWQQDALAAGFQLEAIMLVDDLVAGGVVAVDGEPIEVFPGYWVIPGFLPYDGLVILAALDRRRSSQGETRQHARAFDWCS